MAPRRAGKLTGTFVAEAPPVCVLASRADMEGWYGSRGTGSAVEARSKAKGKLREKRARLTNLDGWKNETRVMGRPNPVK
jgi:hypothetical protein